MTRDEAFKKYIDSMPVSVPEGISFLPAILLTRKQQKEIWAAAWEACCSSNFRGPIRNLTDCISDNHEVNTNGSDRACNNCVHRRECCSTSPCSGWEPSARPQLGVMPKNIWEEKRIQNLASGIMRYVAAGQIHTREHAEAICTWCRELTQRVSSLGNWEV